MSSSSQTSSSSTCHCGSVCYCGLPVFYGEGEDICSSEPISWQHFPPSTSTRSRCDDSSREPRSSLPESPCPESVEEEIPCSSETSTGYPIVKSNSQLKAEHYLRVRHVYEFFNFLIGHLVCAEPEDPIAYLTEILNRCLSYRDCYGEEPLLVTPNHLKSLYDSFDPFGKGSITLEQYEIAMDNIGLAKGITPPNPKPPLNESGRVDENVFLMEAHRCLSSNLKKMLRIPKDWEENRLVWSHVMLQRLMRKKKVLEERPISSEVDFEGELPPCVEQFSEVSSECDCRMEKLTATFLPADCMKKCSCPQLKHEPEQLFYEWYS